MSESTVGPTATASREMTLVEAVQDALATAMAQDPDVCVLGEDVGPDGGVFRATDGLYERFGADRVVDLPLSESLFVGLAVGLATQGFRPVIEFQFLGFMYPAIEQLVSHAGRLRHRTRGRLTCPMVVRAPFGGGVRAPEHHSESSEAMFAHIPGIRVVVASTPARAHGLLLSSIADPDPVVFLEPKRRYRDLREPVPGDQLVQLDHSYIVREGRDVTIVTWGAGVGDAMDAADELARDGVSAEVVDVATLRPLDAETILESVGRTGRCVIVHEAPLTAGFGAEIAARIADEGLTSLMAPVKRVTGYDTVMPLLRLEDHYLPGMDRVLAAVRDVLEYR